MAVEYWLTRTHVRRPSAQTRRRRPRDLAADVAHLKTILPTQSHTMIDVGYHWANLWFAAEKKNWPLARYFFDEARQGVRWTILIRPVRQLPGGGTVDIKGIFTAIDPSAFATVQIAIEDEDSAAFVTAYKQALDGLLLVSRGRRDALPASSRSDRAADADPEFRSTSRRRVSSCGSDVGRPGSSSSHAFRSTRRRFSRPQLLLARRSAAPVLA